MVDSDICSDRNRFNKGEINEDVFNGPFKEYKNKSHMDKTRTKLTKTALIIPTSTHTNKRKHQNKAYVSFKAIVLKLMFRYYNTLVAGYHQVM